MKKIFRTDIFWKYISSVSKYYASNYFSLGRNYIKNFGVYNFSVYDKKSLKNIDCEIELNNYINQKYKISST